MDHGVLPRVHIAERAYDRAVTHLNGLRIRRTDVLNSTGAPFEYWRWLLRQLARQISRARARAQRLHILWVRLLQQARLPWRVLRVLGASGANRRVREPRADAN